LIFLEWTITPIFNPGSWLERSVRAIRVAWKFTPVFPAEIQAKFRNQIFSVCPQAFSGNLSIHWETP
jgi:hypothetical protein